MSEPQDTASLDEILIEGSYSGPVPDFFAYAVSARERKFALAIGGDSIIEGRSKLRRIVACLNACQGISTEILEGQVATSTMLKWAKLAALSTVRAEFDAFGCEALGQRGFSPDYGIFHICKCGEHRIFANGRVVPTSGVMRYMMHREVKSPPPDCEAPGGEP
jgi:hypothetical protein